MKSFCLLGALALIGSLAACNDTTLVPTGVDQVLENPPDEGLTGGPDGEGDTSPDRINDPSVDPADPSDPPPQVIQPSDCDDGIVHSFSPSMIRVRMPDVTRSTGTLRVNRAGTFHVYDTLIAESGATQWNESAYVRIPNDANPDGLPEYSNCEREHIIKDYDNLGAAAQTELRYIGTFRLVEGDNELQLFHYCPLFRSGACSSFHFSDDSRSTCRTSNPNSVHINADDLCLVAAN